MAKTESLTKFDCDHAKSRTKPYKLSGGHGLYLEVMPTGSKLWRYRYKWHGKEKRLALGAYPAISLREARDKVETAKSERRNGIDPSGARQEKKRLAKLNAQNTFEAIATEWHSYYKDTWDKRHGDNLLIRLKNDVFPIIGSIRVNQPRFVHDNCGHGNQKGKRHMADRHGQLCVFMIEIAAHCGKR